jgi:uroporphyrinogen III methyltransferase/synthase
MKQGKVYLIGAGPGDPGLITVKGLDYLKKADVVVYDRLLDSSLLNFVRRHAEKIYVGKSGDYHILEQSEINQILLQKSQNGKMVVRLKGGDPFVFGRGGEEAEFLSNRNIPFEIVPGVTSAIAVPAYAGIPVTHRGLASSVVIVTGHEQVDKNVNNVDWKKISQGADTLVILMIVSNLSYIVGQLVKNCRPVSCPAAIISQGTSSKQQTLVGTLENIISLAEQNKLETPAVLVVGDVVRLRKNLRWFDNTPLFGKRVLVTRAKDQAGELCRLLQEQGAVPVELPALRILPVFDELDPRIRTLYAYNWIIFTSVNGVEIFFHRLYHLGSDARRLGHLSIGAIGEATAHALMQNGIRPECIPERYTSKALLKKLEQFRVAGCKILLPRADIAGKLLAEGLVELGAEVDEIVAYHTIPNKKGLNTATKMLKNGEIDIVTFASSSAVTNLLSILGKSSKALENPLLACIGPVTASTATKAGLKVDIVAQKHTIPGLVKSIVRHYQGVSDE